MSVLSVKHCSCTLLSGHQSEHGPSITRSDRRLVIIGPKLFGHPVHDGHHQDARKERRFKLKMGETTRDLLQWATHGKQGCSTTLTSVHPRQHDRFFFAHFKFTRSSAPEALPARRPTLRCKATRKPPIPQNPKAVVHQPTPKADETLSVPLVYCRSRRARRLRPCPCSAR